MTSLKQHGSVLEYSSQLFSTVVDLTIVKFDYLVINISNADDAKNWLSSNLANISLRIVIVKNNYESDNEPWMISIQHVNVIKTGFT